MKVCSNCGYQNEDNVKFCISCGNNLQNIVESESQVDFNPDNNTYQQPVDDSNFNAPVNQNQFNNQQDFNSQQTTYQQAYRPQKNVWIAVLLDFICGIFFYFLCGVGQIYLGLVKRGIGLCVCGVIVSVINVIIVYALDNILGTIITLILGFGLIIYSAYDAYLCTNALNEGNPLPLLFGSIDLE